MMNEIFSLAPADLQMLETINELRSCNELTERFGLRLSEAQIQRLAGRRFESLDETGRVEFGQGILKALVHEFADSPYIMQENYEDTLCALQDAFYFFKNESMDMISDDELLRFMKQYFDTVCEGSLEYLYGTSLEELCRNTRCGMPPNRSDVFGYPY